MKRKAVISLRFIILAISMIFITIGIIGGEAEAVLLKAVKVCLECIGIG